MSTLVDRGSGASDARAARWAAIRKRGRRRYILLTGVLAYTHAIHAVRHADPRRGKVIAAL